MAELGNRVGRFEVVRVIGRGGMAVVYLAHQTDLERMVALKELPAFHATDPAFAARFLRESRIAGSLGHPNIVTVHDYFEHEGIPYIAMEYMPRGSLRPHVGRLSLAQVAGVLEGLLAALAYAETKGVVHRDLKPENLMVSAEGSVKVADFGIAKALNDASTRYATATGTTVGTPAYMSPEQAMGKQVTPATDLYATGVIAYELLAGKTPFHDIDTPIAVLLKHVNDEPPPLRQIAPGVHPDLEAWVMRLLAKAPDDRPPGAADAWDQLEEIVISTLGPRWRRGARILVGEDTVATPKPLTPAPFADGAPDAAATMPPGAAQVATPLPTVVPTE
ncbi:MAG: serine/threonine-protein kinase, partial [Actinomycetota bacterium]